MSSLSNLVGWNLCNVERFCALGDQMRLRSYQKPVAHAVIKSVMEQEGHLFLVVFPRQSGKNELQAQLEAFLLARLSLRPAQLIKISPTMRPQALNAMHRLEMVLERNQLTRGLWHKEGGNIYRIGQARITFLSGAPESNIVGATASTLLQVDEAQSITIAKYDKEIVPMVASTNATRVLWGTAWTSQTLLARELRASREAEQADGVQRVFITGADVVAREVPAYARFIAGQVARFGRSNPYIKSQFFSEEIDAQGGLFPVWRQALAQGGHPAQEKPAAGTIYAMLVDVAGEDEGLAEAGELKNSARDATAVTIVAVDLGTLRDPLLGRPTYRVVYRWQWVGVRHAALYGMLRDTAERWRARWVVVDATGIGAGIAAFLGNAFPRRVIPFTFNQSSKSQLGWDFCALVDTGRWKEFDPAQASAEQAAWQRLFYEQMAACTFEILPGPAKTMRWGVPESASRAADGQLLHDDLLFSAALCARLDGQDWSAGGQAVLIPRADPLKEIEHGF